MRKPSPQLLNLLADCTPGVTHLALALRELVLTEAPEAEEVLYAVYAEVIVYRFPARKRGAFCYIAAYARHVNLGFYFGAQLRDPHGALQGTGKQMRHIRFDSASDLKASVSVSIGGKVLKWIGITVPAPTNSQATTPSWRSIV